MGKAADHGLTSLGPSARSRVGSSPAMSSRPQHANLILDLYTPA